MPDLETDLVLNVDPTLSAVDQIQQALTALAGQFEADLTSALAVLSDIDDESVTLTVDTEGVEEAQGELEATGLIAEEVDGQLVVVDVSAEGAGEAAEGLREVGTESQAAAASTGAAAGALADLDVDARGAAAGLAESALAIGGVTLGVSELFQNALDAESSLQSFEARTGSAADEVEQLDSQTLGFNSTLGDLALQLGSSDEELRSATARLFALGDAEGFTVARSDALIENVVALAARARTLNPELGSLGGIADTLGTRLQRGGRFVADFGISLSAADIQARALQNTGKELASELTLLEKTEAAAQLATEQLGGSLGEDIQENADNVAISLAAVRTGIEEALEPIGAPLIEPTLDAIESLGPVIADVAGLVADFGVTGLEAIEPLGEAVEPVVEQFAEAGSELLTSVKPALTEVSEALADLLTQNAPLLESAADSIADMGPGLALVADGVADVTFVLSDVLGPLERFAEVTGLLDATLGALNPLTPLQGIGEQFGFAASEAHEMRTETDGVADAFTEADRRGLQLQATMLGVTRSIADEVIEANTAEDGTINYAAALADLELRASETATAEEELAAATDEAATSASVSADQWVRLAEAILAGQVTAADYQTVADDLGVSLQEVEAFAEGVTDAVAQFVDDGLARIPQITEVIGDLEAEFQAQPDAIIAALQESEEAIANFQSNVRTLLAFGLDDLARLAVEKGPEFTNALVNTFRVGRPLLAQELEAQLEGAQTQLDALPGFFEQIAPALGLSARELAESASAGFGTGLDFSTPTGDEVVRSVDALLRGGPRLDTAAEETGTSAGGEYGSGLDLPGRTDESSTGAESVLRNLGLAGSPLSIAALDSGNLIGTSFAIGLGNAFVDAAAPDGFLAAQIRSAVDDLEAAAAASFDFDLSASVSGLPGGVGGVVVQVLPGAVQVNASGKDAKAVAVAVEKGVTAGAVNAGRMLLTEIGAR